MEHPRTPGGDSTPEMSEQGRLEEIERKLDLILEILLAKNEQDRLKKTHQIRKSLRLSPLLRDIREANRLTEDMQADSLVEDDR